MQHKLLMNMALTQGINLYSCCTIKIGGILEKNFTDEHRTRTRQRAKDMACIEGGIITGIRPYTKGNNLGVFEKLGNRLYVSTGGAKNGTILGATHGLQLLKELSK